MKNRKNAASTAQSTPAICVCVRWISIIKTNNNSKSAFKCIHNAYDVRARCILCVSCECKINRIEKVYVCATEVERKRDRERETQRREWQKIIKKKKKKLNDTRKITKFSLGNILSTGSASVNRKKKYIKTEQFFSHFFFYLGHFGNAFTRATIVTCAQKKKKKWAQVKLKKNPTEKRMHDKENKNYSFCYQNARTLAENTACCSVGILFLLHNITTTTVCIKI